MRVDRLWERAPVRLTVHRAREWFCQVLSDHARSEERLREFLREIDRLRSEVTLQQSAAAVHAVGTGAEPQMADLPPVLCDWGKRWHVPWPWLLTRAVVWIHQANRGTEPRLANGLPNLAGQGVVIGEELPGRTSPVGHPARPPDLRPAPEPFDLAKYSPHARGLMEGWRWWEIGRRFYRANLQRAFERALTAYLDEQERRARASGHFSVPDVSTPGRDMWCVIQVRLLDKTQEAIGEEIDSDPRDVRRLLRRTESRLGVTDKPEPGRPRARGGRRRSQRRRSAE